MPATLPNLHERIHSACRAAGRNPSEVRLLAVSKTQPATALRRLHAQGQHAFGENYVDEAIAKQRELRDLELEWHYIGAVQSNKTRALAAAFDWIQSVDRPRIVRRLAEQRPAHLPPLNICLQVNLDAETQKAGCSPAQLPALAAEAAAFQQLRVRGIMVIPAPRESPAEQLAVFRRAAELYRRLQPDHPHVDTLSAGMSADLEAAISTGSTMVRVGTALFGHRTTSDNRGAGTGRSG